MPDVFCDAKRPTPFHPGDILEDTPTRCASPEIEVASFNPTLNSQLRTAVTNWGGGIVHEGTAGVVFEINPAPASGDSFRKQITEICGVLSDGAAKVVASCGLHVHIDCRDVKHYELRRIMTLWDALETAMYALQPSSRRANHFASPWAGKFEAVTQVEHPRVFRKMMMQELFSQYRSVDSRNRVTYPNVRGNKGATHRYYGLNIGAYWYLGTLEFRIHSGTVNPGKIIAHSTLCSLIIDHAVGMKDKDLRAIIQNKLLPEDELMSWGIQYILDNILKDHPLTAEYVTARFLKFNTRRASSPQDDPEQLAETHSHGPLRLRAVSRNGQRNATQPVPGCHCNNCIPGRTN